MMRRIRKPQSPERALGQLGSLLDALTGRRASSAWFPRSRIEQASRLRSRTLSDWSWLWCVKGGPKLDQSGGGKSDHPAARWRV